VPQVEVLVLQSSVAGRETGLSEGDAQGWCPQPPRDPKPHLPVALSLPGRRRAGKREQRGDREWDGVFWGQVPHSPPWEMSFPVATARSSGGPRPPQNPPGEKASDGGCPLWSAPACPQPPWGGSARGVTVTGQRGHPTTPRGGGYLQLPGSGRPRSWSRCSHTLRESKALRGAGTPRAGDRSRGPQRPPLPIAPHLACSPWAGGASGRRRDHQPLHPGRPTGTKPTYRGGPASPAPPAGPPPTPCAGAKPRLQPPTPGGWRGGWET